MNLILIKHSMPHIEPEKPAAEWALSPHGYEQCVPLAQKLERYQPAAIVSSTELKARETARLVAETLDLPVEVMDNLHEHDRRENAPYSHDVNEFHQRVAAFFKQPDQLVFGLETADAAYSRFEGAIGEVLNRHPEQTVAVVTHGTVLSLFVSRKNHLDPFPLWRSLKLPAFVVLSLPDFRLVEVVEAVKTQTP